MQNKQNRHDCILDGGTYEGEFFVKPPDEVANERKEKMCKSKMEDLNNHLFEALERLNDLEAGDVEGLDFETKRAKSVCSVAKEIIKGANCVVNAARVKSDMLSADVQIPAYLGIEVSNG